MALDCPKDIDAMASYRLQIRNIAYAAHYIDAKTDAEALAICRRELKGHDWDLRCGERRVAVARSGLHPM